MSGALRELRQLGQAAVAADDAALARLVAMLDALPDRGEIDRVLDPVRPRLRALGLPRPLGLPRLLFLPLDGAILPPARWARGAAAVPRSALMALAGAVQAALGAEGTAIAAACAPLSTNDFDAIAALGARLWPAAAEALPQAAPPGWAATGLAPADYAPIAALCRPHLAGRAGDLGGAGQRGRRAAGGARAGRAGRGGAGRAGAARGHAGHAAAAGERAGRPGAACRRAGPGGAGGGDAGAGPGAGGAAAALRHARPAGGDRDGAADRAPAGEPGELRPARQRPAAPGAGLPPRGGRGLPGRFPGRGRAAAGGAGAAAGRGGGGQRCRGRGDGGRGARRLRALEGAGRKLGGAPAYDRALRDLTTSLGTLGAQARHPAGLRPVDLARSVEILAGPEAAAALLRA